MSAVTLMNRLKRFQSDDRGSSTLEQVVIFAFGALILGAVWGIWTKLPIGEDMGLGSAIGTAISELMELDFSLFS